MINSVVLMGRITHDLELKQTPSGTPVLRFSLAVERNYSKQGEARQTDFIPCTAWRQTAEFIYKYFAKGRMIAVTGELQSNTVTDQGSNKTYYTVNVKEASFTGEPKPEAQQAQAFAPQQAPQQAYTPQQQAALQLNLDDFEEILSDGGVPF